MNTGFHRRAIGLMFLSAAPILLIPASAAATDLRPETLKAWHASVELVERRVASELTASGKFLALDFQDPKEAGRERSDVMAGEIPVKKIDCEANGERRIEVPDGMIQHWRGSVLIPGVTLDFVLSAVQNPDPEDTRQEDVLEYRILEKTPAQLRIYLKLKRSKIVTVVYSTEHVVQYRREGDDRASSRSVSTKIAEIEHPQQKDEREKPEGHDRGFLWRMNSYWRYQQVPGGVIVECESMTLSRSIPGILEPMIRPIINSVARESMHRTLESLRARLLRTHNSRVSGVAGNLKSVDANLRN